MKIGIEYVLLAIALAILIGLGLGAWIEKSNDIAFGVDYGVTQYRTLLVQRCTDHKAFPIKGQSGEFQCDRAKHSAPRKR